MLEGGPGGSPSSGAATGKVPGGQSDGQAVHADVGVDDPSLVRAVVVGGHGIAAPLVNPRGVRARARELVMIPTSKGPSGRYCREGRIATWDVSWWAEYAGSGHAVGVEAGMNRSNQATMRVQRSITAGN